MATKQIIVLNEDTDGLNVTYRTAFWFPITLNPAPAPQGSAWVPVTGVSAGASPAENQAITSGSIKEELQPFSFPIGTPIAAIESVLQAAWAKRNAQIGGQGAEQFYGAFFDGSAWGQS